MNDKLVTEENWTHCGYISTKAQALITMGSEPSQCQIIYYLTLLDNDYKELFQQEFASLAEAVSVLNDRYCHWQFVDREQENVREDGDGCGSCQAH